VATIRKCSKCGRQAHDALLVQCPDCRVPFVTAQGGAPELSSEQLSAVVTQVFGSWKFWAILAVLISLSAWAVVKVSDRVIEARSKEFLREAQERNASQMSTALSVVSNQIAGELRQPRIHAAIEQAARDQARELFTNDVVPSVAAFHDALEAANAELARATNSISALMAASSNSQRRLAELASNANLALALQTNQGAPSTTAPNAGNVKALKLSLANRSITQTPNSYVLTLFFRNTGGASGGSVEMVAGTYKQTARIIAFSSMTSPTKNAAEINDVGDAARLVFDVAENESPALSIEFSGPTIVRFVSESFDNDLIIPVAADKITLTNASK
jgi:hypothetical protein